MSTPLYKSILTSSLARAVTAYGATNALNKAIPFLLIPLFTRFLTPLDYGIISMFGVTLSIITVISGFGSSNAIVLKYFQQDSIDLGAYVGNCLFLLLVSSAAVALALLAFPEQMERLTDYPAVWNWAALVLSAANFVTLALLSLWQSSTKPYRFGAFQLLQTVANIALSLWFIASLRMGWQGRVHAQWIVSVVFAGVALYLLRKEGWLSWKLNRAYMGNALKIGVPLLPHALGGFIIDTTDRIMITNMVGLEDTGIYTVGLQVGMILLFLTGSFNMAWVPWLFGKLKTADDEWKRRIVIATYAYGLALICVALLLTFTAPWLFRVFIGSNFSGSASYVFWSALGYAFNGMYMMATNYIFYAEKTHLVAWVTFASALVNIAASYWLIRFHGAVGAAQGAMLAHLCSFLLTWFLSSRVYPMPWSLRREKG